MGNSPGRGGRPLRTSHKRFVGPPGQRRHESGEGARFRAPRRSLESYSPDLSDVIERKQPPAAPPQQRSSQDQLRQSQFRSLTGSRTTDEDWPGRPVAAAAQKRPDAPTVHPRVKPARAQGKFRPGAASIASGPAMRRLALPFSACTERASRETPKHCSEDFQQSQ
jgi:hypothetical protein